MAAPKKQAPRSAMSARLSALHAETNLPKPYEVADGITVTPPGRKRSQAMADAEARIYVNQALLQAALKPDAEATQEQLSTLSDEVTKARTDYEKAFFGDAYDKVIAYFDDESIPTKLWEAFVVDIRNEFLPVAPEDGVCPTCGHVDDETAGKELEPST
jgi:hypothetical protein